MALAVRRFSAPASGTELSRYATDGESLWVFGANSDTYASIDDGATWKKGANVGTGMDENKVVELSDGVVVIGLGRFGKSLALELEREGIEVLGIKDVTGQPHNGCRAPKRRRG